MIDQIKRIKDLIAAHEKVIGQYPEIVEKQKIKIAIEDLKKELATWTKATKKKD